MDNRHAKTILLLLAASVTASVRPVLFDSSGVMRGDYYHADPASSGLGYSAHMLAYVTGQQKGDPPANPLRFGPSTSSQRRKRFLSFLFGSSDDPEPEVVQETNHVSDFRSAPGCLMPLPQVTLEYFKQIEQNDVDGCMLRTICEIAADPSAYGAFGDRVNSYFRQCFRPFSGPGWQYKVAADLGHTYQTGKVCVQRYPECKVSTRLVAAYGDVL